MMEARQRADSQRPEAPIGRPPSKKPPRTVEGLTRNETVRKHLPKVRYLAKRLVSRIPSDAAITVDDLISHGSIGLIEAFDHFEEQYGIKFSSFAEHRIRGAMLDALRKTDPLGRRQRSLARQAEQARALLTREQGAPPTATDVAERLGLALEDYFSVQRSVAASRTASLDVREDGRGAGDAPPKPASRHHSSGMEVMDRLVQQDTSKLIGRALQTLPDRQRTMVELVYLKGMQSKDIAALMGLSKARVSQLLAQARQRLRIAIEREAREQGFNWWETIGEPTR